MQQPEIQNIVGSPFEIFPREIWQMVIEELHEVEDIQNVFEAIPEIEQSSLNKRFSWLIVKIMPLLASRFLSVKDLVACRQVSRRWRNAVDISLETHPDRMPYKSPRLQVMTGKTHNCYGEVPKFCTNARKVLEELDDVNIPESLGPNPFPGRYLHLIIKDRSACLDIPPGALFFSDAIQLLERFGREVWYIRFGSPRVVTLHADDVLMKLFLRCMSLLPNLKSLEIGDMFGHVLHKDSLDVLTRATIPFQLETIHVVFVSSYPKHIFHHFLTALASHGNVKKLAIYPNQWDNSYATLFPNLAELQILSGKYQLYINVAKIRPMLQSLQSSPIRNVVIGAGGNPINISHILQTLEPLRVERFELLASLIWESKRNRKFRVSSVRELQISASTQLRFQFLDKLPSLELLTISHGGSSNLGLEEYQSTGWSNMGTHFTFSECLQRYYRGKEYQPDTFKDIWAKLPKLRVLKLHGASDGITRTYGRDPIHS